MGGKKGKGGGGNKEKKEKKLKALEAKKKKQEAKAAKKGKKKAQQEVGEEDDLEAILKEIQEQDAAIVAVTVDSLESPPSCRNYCTISPIDGSDEVLIYGGEYFDGDTSVCYNDVYRYNYVKDEWKSVSSPNTPPPRCSHQAVSVREHIYIFGGEFSTTYQFHHYRDLWRFNVNTNSWESIETKTGPSPRSGHRMTLWKHYLVLFGGFYETTRGLKRFNDLYFFDLREQKWIQAEVPNTAQQPSPRSGCQLIAHTSKNMVYMYGGYAKVAVSGNKQKGKNLDDMWALHLTLPKVAGQCPGVRWEPIAKKGSPPCRRSGASSILYKNRILLFGGVTDKESTNDVEGEFHNSLHAFDLDRHRWYQLEVKPKTKTTNKKRKKKKEQKCSSSGDKEESDDDDSDPDSDDNGIDLDDSAFYVVIDGEIVRIDVDEDEDEREHGHEEGGDSQACVTADNLATITISDKAAPADESDLSTNELDMSEKAKVLSDKELECAGTPANAQDSNLDTLDVSSADVNLALESEDADKDKQISDVPPSPDLPEPYGRMAAGLMLSGNKLIVLWGQTELGDYHVNFDDIWQVDLNTLEAWTQTYKGEWEDKLDKIQQDMQADDAEEDEDDSFDGISDVSDIEVEIDQEHQATRKNLMLEIKRLQEHLGDEDDIPQSRESLRDFFTRTGLYWVKKAAKINIETENNEHLRMQGKELRRAAFKLAEERYSELLPILEKLDELEEEQQYAEELVRKQAKINAIRAQGGKLKKKKDKDKAKK